MWLMWITGVASAADLHFAFTTGEDISESWTQNVSDAKTQSFGPVEGKGKRSVVYAVTTPPSVYDPMNDAYQVEVSVCREWVKGSKGDRDCVTEVVMASSDASAPGRVAGIVKASDKFQFSVDVHYTGEPPIPPGLPQIEPEPEEPAEE